MKMKKEKKMMQQGYVKIFRQIVDWEWYTDIPVRILFEHCLLKANHQDKEWRGILIKKGSFITSYENLSKETGLTIRQVRTAINKLQSTNELTYQSTSQYSIITVNNWNKFQEDDKQNDKQMTSERQTNDKRATTNKNEKNEKNEKNDKNINKEKEKFDLFFKQFPNQENEYKTFNLFESLLNEEIVTFDELMQGVKRYKDYCAAAGRDAKYIKSPFNWLSDMSWKNKYEVKNEKPYRYNAFAN